MIKDSISCLCVTHDRPDKLKQAIAMFKQQTVHNKELVILYEQSDWQTQAIAESDPNYLSLCLENQFDTEAYFFVFGAFGKDLTFPLETNTTVFFKANGGGWLVPELDGGLVYKQRITFKKEEGFYVQKRDEGYAFRTAFDTFLRAKTDGKLGHETHRYDDSFFQINTLGNGKLRLSTIYGSTIEPLIDQEGFVRHGGIVKMDAKPTASVKFIAINSDKKISLGLKRNLGLKFCQGDYIAIWDDDDWYAPNRLEAQLAAIQDSPYAACSLARLRMYVEANQEVYTSFVRTSGWEGSLLCKSESMVRYEYLDKGEDTPVLQKLLYEGLLKVIDRPELYIYQIHGSNTWSGTHFSRLLHKSEKMLNGAALEVINQIEDTHLLLSK